MDGDSCRSFQSLRTHYLVSGVMSTNSEDEKPLPSFDELPNFHQYTGCAWGVWGEGDELGTVNLLTEKVVAEAAKEIRCVL